MTRMRENDLNRPGTAGNIPGEPDGWGWLLGFVIPAVVPPLVAWIVHRTDEKEKQKLEKEHQHETLKAKIQMDHLEQESGTVRDKLTSVQEENSKLREKLASHHEVKERDQHYISKLEEENQTLKQDYKKQQEQIYQLAQRLSDAYVETNVLKEPESPKEARMGPFGFTLKDSQAYKQKEREIRAKEEYLTKLEKQLRERQDMKCSYWNPMKSSWHREHLERQMLGEADTSVHARGLRVPAALREIFKYDDYCAQRPEDHGRLMWTFWRQWKMEVEREKYKLLAERLAQDPRKN
uniref:Uncharacterized protein n=1 Tax=Branchiostoma floridae TaxID=7739 RepID=C3ZCF2_BRAFL|eukprot:XP_002593771.1 hypothetical protein BRAFLDRAFT_104341 [Branchiostoma floridae]